MSTQVEKAAIIREFTSRVGLFGEIKPSRKANIAGTYTTKDFSEVSDLHNVASRVGIRLCEARNGETYKVTITTHREDVRFEYRGHAFFLEHSPKDSDYPWRYRGCNYSDRELVIDEINEEEEL